MSQLANNSASPFPSPPRALLQPSQYPVHAVQHTLTSYTNSDAFSEVTSYDNSDNFSDASSYSPSALSRKQSTRQLEGFGNKFLNAIAENVKVPPAVAGLSRSKTIHSRARSFASFVPSLNSSAVEEQDGSAAQGSVRRRPSSQIFKSGSLRRPSTAPHEENEDYNDTPFDTSPLIMDYKPTLTGGPDRQRPQAEQAPQPIRPTVGGSLRKLGWFGSNKQSSSSRPSIATSPDLFVDLRKADFLQPASTLLFPNGTPDSQDPARFQELLRNAETLITRIQAAYNQQSAALQNARQEREAASEEAQEANTRAKHLKSQLDEIGSKAIEQENAMKAMAQELAEERLRRVEDHERWERMQRRGSMIQDETTPKKRATRESGGSAGSANSMSSIASDSGFESDYYAEIEIDPTLSPTSSRPMSPVHSQMRWESTGRSARPLSSRSIQGRSTCEVDVGVFTWMKDERSRLELRVRELEGVVDGCLDLVSRA